MAINRGQIPLPYDTTGFPEGFYAIVLNGSLVHRLIMFGVATEKPDYLSAAQRTLRQVVDATAAWYDELAVWR